MRNQTPKLFDAELQTYLRKSELSKRIEELQEEMTTYKRACRKIESVINSISELELFGTDIYLHSVDVNNITKLTSQDNLSDGKTLLTLVYRFDPKFPISTDWYHNYKDIKYLVRLKSSLIKKMEWYALKQIEDKDMHFDVLINENKEEEMCMVCMFNFDYIKYEKANPTSENNQQLD